MDYFTQPLGYMVVVMAVFFGLSALVVIAIITVLPRMLNTQVGWSRRETVESPMQGEDDDFEITAFLRRMESRISDIEDRLERIERRWR